MEYNLKFFHHNDYFYIRKILLYLFTHALHKTDSDIVKVMWTDIGSLLNDEPTNQNEYGEFCIPKVLCGRLLLQLNVIYEDSPTTPIGNFGTVEKVREKVNDLIINGRTAFLQTEIKLYETTKEHVGAYTEISFLERNKPVNPQDN